MNDASSMQIVDGDKYQALKDKLDKESRLKYLIKSLTNFDTKYLLGNTRFFQSYEIDRVVMNKEIGEQIHDNMISYYKNVKNYNKTKLNKVKKNILLNIVDKNLLARWSIRSLSKEELIALGIGAFREETKEQVSQSVLSNIPIIGRVFK